jgi:hypothetical protein
MQAGSRSWWTCKAFASRIESLTLFDELSNRYQIWELPPVLEMRNFSRCRDCLPEYQPCGQCIASHGWVQLDRCGWICSGYTNVVLSGINIVSHAVPRLRLCRVLAARTQTRSATIVSGTRPLCWAFITVENVAILTLASRWRSGTRASSPSVQVYMTLSVLGKKCKILTTNVLTARLHA